MFLLRAGARYLQHEYTLREETATCLYALARFMGSLQKLQTKNNL